MASCKKESKQFNLSLDQIIQSQSQMRGTIFDKRGFPGPYHEECAFVGVFNTAGQIRAGSGNGSVTSSWNATPNYFFEGTAYSNAKDEGFVVVRKVSRSDLKTAEQGAAANPLDKE